MKKKKMAYLGALASAALLTACGSGYMADTTEAITVEEAYDNAAVPGGGIYSRSAAYDGGEYDMAAEEAGTGEVAEAAEEAASSEGQSGNPVPEESAVSQKLIKNVRLELETKGYDSLLADITAEVNRLGGYIENSTSSDYSQGSARNASIVARVPSESLDGFVNKVAEASNVVYRNESVQDVTLQYVDLDSHKKSLLTEQERLLELLEKAETVADVIEIESRLSEVRYQVESMESQLRMIDNQVSYSTVYIEIYEVELLTPVAEKTVWQKISDGFGNNVYRLGRGLENLFVGLIISLPFILVWVVVIVIVLVIVRFILKQEKKMREKKQAQRQAQGPDYIIVPTGNGQNGVGGPAGTGQHGVGSPAETGQPEKKDGQNGTTV